ncbi:MAG: NADH-ubiquinone oxidoreductase-F iron-sulfur binding region domain-containing protein [bacterium]
MNEELLEKIRLAQLIGRGGAEFPTVTKWEFVKKAQGKQKYVICNASEGELGLFKDIFILKNYPDKVLKGMKLAMDFIETKEAYFNINKNYYDEVGEKLKELVKTYEQDGYNFTFYIEEPSYIGGEETALLNAIEKQRVEPRLKPPYPSDAGLFGCPTLIHNVETLYNVALVSEDKFEDKRFYCISGDLKNPGVYQYLASDSIKEILQKSNNWDDESNFFAQIGGSASGPVLNKKQMSSEKVGGAGSIEVYSEKTSALTLLKKWLEFYSKESCGKCTPCREGTYQLYKLVGNLKEGDKIPWHEISELTEDLKITSFCALGRSIYTPINSYLENILNNEK